ncbi:RNA-binding protein 42-like [Zingiber officinale]|uniref:RNA-binding protein 42-like n=1 Tax=Zingiber officinale TaxID=94328 RepID=UPI001C4D918C|nr:RNA-binding protein 42-like [Zingiber officinale]
MASAKSTALLLLFIVIYSCSQSLAKNGENKEMTSSKKLRNLGQRHPFVPSPPRGGLMHGLGEPPTPPVGFTPPTEQPPPAAVCPPPPPPSYS